MGVGYTTIMYDDESLLHGIGDVGACRYDGVEIGLEKVRSVGVETVRDRIDESGLDPYLVMSEWVESDDAADRCADGAHIAADLGAEFFGILPPQRGRVDDETFANWLDRICEAAADAGVTPLLHHHGATKLEQPDEIEIWLNRGPENVRLIFDTAHYYPYGDVTDGIERFADDIEYVHLKDVAPPSDFQHHVDALTAANFHLDNIINYFRAFTDLGAGDLHFAAAYRTLNDIGYSGHYTIEIENQTMDPLVHAKKNIDYWQSVTDE